MNHHFVRIFHDLNMTFFSTFWHILRAADKRYKIIVVGKVVVHWTDVDELLSLISYVKN